MFDSIQRSLFVVPFFFFSFYFVAYLFACSWRLKLIIKSVRWVDYCTEQSMMRVICRTGEFYSYGEREKGYWIMRSSVIRHGVYISSVQDDLQTEDDARPWAAPAFCLRLAAWGQTEGHRQQGD